MSVIQTTPLLERYWDTQRNLKRWWFRLWGSGLLLIIVVFAVAWFFVEPAPPNRIVIAVGAQDGAYWQFAQQYAEVFKQYDIELELRETAGSLENYRLLSDENEVHVAIVQGGSAPEEIRESNQFESIASLYFEPVWVFYRGDKVSTEIRQLKGKTIAVGRENSGTQVLSRLLLKENGVESASTSRFVEIGGEEAKAQLLAGKIDAAFYVTSPQSQIIHDLIQTEDVKLLSFERHEAYSQRFPFLSDAVLQRGVIDLSKSVPKEDVHLVSPTANLVASPELHDSLIPLFIKAATLTHERGERLMRSEKFPSTDFIEFPLNESARLYFESGPPLLQKYLPFWLASFVDRGKVLLLPLITLIFPLFKIAPPVYRWRIRSRIYKWYELLRAIEANLKPGTSRDILLHQIDAVADIEKELDDLSSVPLSHMEEFYNLRLHVELVRGRVKRLLEKDATLQG
ncbi:ABC transporter substrate-binding protein [bacterium]|nr:ABC transporter substrate-binding protein [bacterium]